MGIVRPLVPWKLGNNMDGCNAISRQIVSGEKPTFAVFRRGHFQIVSVGDRTADDGRFQHFRARDIGYVAAVAVQKARVFLAKDLRADPEF